MKITALSPNWLVSLITCLSPCDWRFLLAKRSRRWTIGASMLPRLQEEKRLERIVERSFRTTLLDQKWVEQGQVSHVRRVRRLDKRGWSMCTDHSLTHSPTHRQTQTLPPRHAHRHAHPQTRPQTLPPTDTPIYRSTRPPTDTPTHHRQTRPLTDRPAHRHTPLQI